jgi:hypothetical protein
MICDACLACPVAQQLYCRRADKSCCVIVAVSRDSVSTEPHDSSVPIAFRGTRMLQIFRSGLSC